MPRRSSLPTLLAALGLAAGAAAGDGHGPSPSDVVLRRCAVEFDRAATIGSPTWSVLQDRLVDPGDRVAAGQVLGRLQDKDLRVEVEMRAAEADDDVEVRLGQAKYDRALVRLKGSEALRLRNVLSFEDLAVHQLEARSAALDVEQARHRRRLADIRRRQVEAQIKARELVSPLDGVVVAVEKRQGEPVLPGEPVFRVVSAHRLRVTGRLDVVDAWRAAVGQPVSVRVEVAGADLPIEREVFDGKVVFVDNQIDPKSRTCKVVAVVDNRDDLLRAGLEACMEIRTGASNPAADGPTAGTERAGRGRSAPRIPTN